MALALLVSGFCPAPGSAGFGRSVSLCPASSPGMPAGPSTATIAALLGGTAGCNTAAGLAADENAVRTLSVDTGGPAVGVPPASAELVDFRLDL